MRRPAPGDPRLPRVGRARVVAGLTAVLLLPWTPCAAREDGSVVARDPPRVRLTRTDAWFGLGAAAAIGAAAFADLDVRERARRWDGDGARHLARAVRPFGAPEVVGPAVLAAYLAGRALDRPALAGSARRIGISVAVVAAATEALKVAVGRVRPDESAAEVDRYQPFSGHDAFPSGHASLSFAWATAVDRETRARWVPWAVYPLAGLVGWSRVRDDRHWASDVVAGAALGAWTAARCEDYLRARDERAGRLSLGLDAAGGSPRLAARVRF